MIEEAVEETYEEENTRTIEESGEDTSEATYEEYEEVEETKEFSILDLSEFIKKTELWTQFIEGKLQLTELLKEEKAGVKKTRRTGRTRKQTKKEREKPAKKKTSKSSKKKSSTKGS